MRVGSKARPAGARTPLAPGAPAQDVQAGVLAAVATLVFSGLVANLVVVQFVQSGPQWVALLLQALVPPFALFRALWEVSQYAFLASQAGGTGAQEERGLQCLAACSACCAAAVQRASATTPPGMCTCVPAHPRRPDAGPGPRRGGRPVSGPGAHGGAHGHRALVCLLLDPGEALPRTQLAEGAQGCELARRRPLAAAHGSSLVRAQVFGGGPESLSGPRSHPFFPLGLRLQPGQPGGWAWFAAQAHAAGLRTRRAANACWLRAPFSRWWAGRAPHPLPPAPGSGSVRLAPAVEGRASGLAAVDSTARLDPRVGPGGGSTSPGSDSPASASALPCSKPLVVSGGEVSGGVGADVCAERVRVEAAWAAMQHGGGVAAAAAAAPAILLRDVRCVYAAAGPRAAPPTADRGAPGAAPVPGAPPAAQQAQHVALAGLSLAVEAGEVFGLLGPNGAGKTTTLRIMQGAREAPASCCRRPRVHHHVQAA